MEMGKKQKTEVISVWLSDYSVVDTERNTKQQICNNEFLF